MSLWNQKLKPETHFDAKSVFASHLPLPVKVADKKAYRETLAKSLVYPRHLLIGQLVLRQQLWRGRSHLQNGKCENVIFDAAVVTGGAPAHPPATVL